MKAWLHDLIVMTCLAAVIVSPLIYVIWDGSGR